MRLCCIEGCDKPHLARGWCSMHYTRWKERGDPLDEGAGRPTPNGEPQRFLNDLLAGHRTDECVTWPYSRTEKGYGTVRINGRQTLVHRYICAQVNGPPPSDKHDAAHSCGGGFSGCCNKDHLRWATKSENAQDKFLHGTASLGEKNGSSLLSEETVLQIVSMSAAMKQKEIADTFGIHKTTVQGILCGKSWGWLTGIPNKRRHKAANDNGKKEMAA